MTNKDKIIDLHIHTNYSDGELSPEEIIKLAIKKNIGIISLTDHDTIDGIKSINKSNYNIEIINGIELSANSKKGRIHILGYGIDLNNIDLNKKLLELKDNNLYSFLSILEQIKKDYGLKFSYDEIKELINSKHIRRPDIARLCIKYGYVTTVQEAFNKYLIEAYNKTKQINPKPSFKDCIELILNSNGIPVLAHPKSLDLSPSEFLTILKEMINYGLMGIEVYHSIHTKEEMLYYLQIAQQYNLLISGGSDYHGKTVKPNIELGSGKNNNLKIKRLSILNKLH